jgi:hypothetical protein
MIRMQRVTRLFTATALVAASVSCGSVVREGRAPVYLVIDRLEAIRGAPTAGTPTSNLVSDVVTVVTSGGACTLTAPCATFFGDSGTVTLRAPLKDVVTATTPAAPTTNNEVTITRYRVEYTRADGRNTPGVDVPYPFDGGVTGTIPANGSVTLGFVLVRTTAKQESPLIQLQVNPGVITTLTKVTFYGKDRVGNDVSVTGLIHIDFGNFGDF